MRPTGRAAVDSRYPRAFGVCDRCGFLYNHDALRWQYDWRGVQLQNLRVLVCQSCIDKPQQNGQRTFVLPPDPVAIQNARPENYVSDNNPLSAIGANASPALYQFGTRFGSITGIGGVQSAFDGNPLKPSWQSAGNTISDSSYGGYLGINWGGDVSGLTTPSSLMAPIITHVLSSYAIYAPTDRSFLGSNPTDYVIQGSAVDTSLYAAWTTLSSGTTNGTAGEVITGSPSSNSGAYQFHRVAFLGDGLTFLSVAQVSFSVADTGTLS